MDRSNVEARQGVSIVQTAANICRRWITSDEFVNKELKKNECEQSEAN